jgi:hypothetical protein
MYNMTFVGPQVTFEFIAQVEGFAQQFAKAAKMRADVMLGKEEDEVAADEQIEMVMEQYLRPIAADAHYNTLRLQARRELRTMIATLVAVASL